MAKSRTFQDILDDIWNDGATGSSDPYRYYYPEEEVDQVGPRTEEELRPGLISTLGRTARNTALNIGDAGAAVAVSSPEAPMNPFSVAKSMLSGVGYEDAVLAEQAKADAETEALREHQRQNVMLPALQRYSQRSQESAEMQALRDPGMLEQGLYDAVNSLSSYAPITAGVITGLATKNPAAAVSAARVASAIPTVDVLARTFAERKIAGDSDEQAMERAVVEAGIELGTEQLIPGFGKGKAGLLKFLKLMGTEQASEQLATAGSTIAGVAYGDETAQEALEAAPGRAARTAVATFLGAGPTAALGASISDLETDTKKGGLNDKVVEQARTGDPIVDAGIAIDQEILDEQVKIMEGDISETAAKDMRAAARFAKATTSLKADGITIQDGLPTETSEERKSREMEQGFQEIARRREEQLREQADRSDILQAGPRITSTDPAVQEALEEAQQEYDTGLPRTMQARFRRAAIPQMPESPPVVPQFNVKTPEQVGPMTLDGQRIGPSREMVPISPGEQVTQEQAEVREPANTREAFTGQKFEITGLSDAPRATDFEGTMQQPRKGRTTAPVEVRTKGGRAVAAKKTSELAKALTAPSRPKVQSRQDAMKEIAALRRRPADQERVGDDVPVIGFRSPSVFRGVERETQNYNEGRGSRAYRVLDDIANDKEVPQAMRMLARKMSPILRATETTIKFADDVRGYGRYHAVNNAIDIGKGGRGDLETVLHEAVHAATMNVLGNQALLEQRPELKRANDELVNVLNVARKAFIDQRPDLLQSQDPFVQRLVKRGESPTGSLRDIRELAAYSMTNPEFQDFMKSVPYGSESKRSLWDIFIASLKKLLGFDDIEGTALEAVISSTGSILDWAEQNPQAYADQRIPAAMFQMEEQVAQRNDPFYAGLERYMEETPIEAQVPNINLAFTKNDLKPQNIAFRRFGKRYGGRLGEVLAAALSPNAGQNRLLRANLETVKNKVAATMLDAEALANQFRKAAQSEKLLTSENFLGLRAKYRYEEGKQRLIFDALSGKEEAVNALNKNYPKTATVVDKMRAMVDNMSLDMLETLVQSGDPKMIEEYNGLKDSFIENLGQYLHRFYLVHTDKRYGEKLMGKVDSAQRKQGRNLSSEEANALKLYEGAMSFLTSRYKIPSRDEMDAMHVSEVAEVYNGFIGSPRGLTKEKMMDDLSAMTNDEKIARFDTVIRELVGQIKSARDTIFTELQAGRDRGILQKRENVPPAIRDLLGEVNSVMQTFLTTIREQSELNAVTQLQNELSKYDGTWFSDGQNRPSSFTAKIPDTQAYGPLAGKYTTQEIADSINSIVQRSTDTDSFTQVLEDNSKFLAAASKLVGKALSPIGRAAKTVTVLFAIDAYLANMASSLGMQASLATFTNPKQALRDSGRAIKAFAKMVDQKNVTKVDPVFKRMVKLGLVDSANVGDILRGIKDFNFDERTRYLPAIKRGVDIAGHTFLATDAYVKYVAFEQQKDLLSGFYKRHGINKSEQEIEFEAADRAKNMTFSYERAFSLGRSIERSGWTQFLVYMTETARVQYNIMKYTARDMAIAARTGDIPLMFNSIARVAANASYWAMRNSVLTGLGSALGLAPGEDEEDKYKGVPEYVRNHPLWIFGKVNGTEYVYDAARLDAFDPTYEFFTDVVPKMLNGDASAGDAMAQFLVRNAGSYNLTTSAVNMIARGIGEEAPFNKSPNASRLDMYAPETHASLKNFLVNGMGTSTGVMADVLSALNPYVPKSPTAAISGLWEDREGDPLATTAMTAGAAIVPVDPMKQIRGFEGSQYRQAISNSQKDLRTYLTDPDLRKDEARIESMLLDMIVDQYQAWKPMNDLLDSALAMKIPRAEITAALNEAGIPKEDVPRLMRDRFVVREIGERTIDLAIEEIDKDKTLSQGEKQEARRNYNQVKRVLTRLQNKYKFYDPENSE